ncbi:MAG: HIRAN domain-containing protein [Candidatus Accumulibacter sp.]|jgi:hypothetical protein|nr:HIRAN domain-containing protein [Accumulibacter sp.]
MSRRLFLERVAVLVGIGIATPVARAAVPRGVELQRSPVAGFQYHQGAAIWPWLVVGASLSLVREPDNAYDPRAVRVDWQGRKLGYIPRIDNAAASHLLDSGHVLEARIVALRDSENPWGRVEFAIFLGEPGADDGR